MTLLPRALLVVLVLVGLNTPSQADRMENGVAVFAALDKVTARISELEVPIDETVTFGSIQVTPRICYSRPPTEKPKTTTFVEIEETKIDGTNDRLFTGWMLAESPGLNALEHPVFDVWLTGCKTPKEGAPSAAANQTNQGTGENVGQVPAPREAAPFQRRRRIRR
ncbi:MAG: DUF2155 domain-containing protein [Filomicrobium sp.]